MRRVAGRPLACLLACAAAACASATGWPRTVSVADVRAAPTFRGDWIASYDEALASITAVMTRDLGLPAPQAWVHFYRDRQAFQAALEATGYDPAFARDTAAALTGVSGYRRVLVNDDGLRDVGWHFRIGMLAHELTHTLQYEFSNGVRGTSDQWLREGFAEWVEVQVLTALGFTTRQTARTIALRQMRAAGRQQPTLADMVTFPEWVALALQAGQEPIYAQALLAADFLIDRHGVDAAVAYFRLFAASNDRVDNFRRAFGEELPAFTTAFAEHLARLLR